MPIDPDEGNASLDPDEAIARLGHETRVAIVLALWDTFESAPRDNWLERVPGRSPRNPQLSENHIMSDILYNC